jgi:hypothetical protein
VAIQLFTELPEQGTPPGYSPTWILPGRGTKFDNLKLWRNLRHYENDVKMNLVNNRDGYRVKT